MGDYDSIYGFATLGLDIYPVSGKEEASKLFRKLAEGDYGVIYVTEALEALISDEIAAYDTAVVPAVIPIPGVYGNTGSGIRNVKKSVEQAVGSDILFGEE